MKRKEDSRDGNGGTLPQKAEGVKALMKYIQPGHQAGEEGVFRGAVCFSAEWFRLSGRVFRFSAEPYCF